MKKILFFLGCLISFSYAEQSFAQQQVQQQSIRKEAGPVTVNVNVSNTATANGNTLSPQMQNSLPAQNGRYGNYNTNNSYVKELSGTGSLYGNYPESPYQADFQTEMLRHTVWGSLVPRKQLFDDPAKGRYPWRYSTKKVVSKKVETKKELIDVTKLDLDAICKEREEAKKQANVVKNENNTTDNVANSIVINTKDIQKEEVKKTEEVKEPSIYEPVNENKQNEDIQRKVEEIQDALLAPSVK